MVSSNSNKKHVLEDEWTATSFQNKRDYSPRYFLVILIVLISTLFGVAFLEKPSEIRLGLDLRGGTTIVLQPEQVEAGEITPQGVNQALEILRQRVDSVGVSESEIRAEGSGSSTKIVVSVPGTTERELVDLVGQTAKLSIRPVVFMGTNSGSEVTTENFPSDVDKETQSAYKAWSCPKEVTSTIDDVRKVLIACDESGGTKFILGATNVEGSQISDARFSLDQGSLGWITTISFDRNGKIAFGELTSQISSLSSPRNQIAIVLDGKIVTAPRVDGPITGGSVLIYGGFTQEYAKQLSNILKYGALPFSFRVDEVQQVSPTLGASQLKSGLAAGILGLLLISLYLLGYYRALGVLAVGSLGLAFVISFALFIVLGRSIGLTLTLAGIAGAIVSIGVTADSFIVYFERVRDEMRMGSSLRVALERGWLRAKRTIVIADAVSLLAAIILYLFTTGNVRGFAFTLGLTTVIDLFIVYFFTRPILVLLSKLPFFAQGHHLSGLSQESLGIINASQKKRILDLGGLGGRLYRGESSVDVVHKPSRWFLLSGALIVASTLALSILGLNLGLEFKGGSVNTVNTSIPSVDLARNSLSEVGYQGQAIVQVLGKNKVRIETDQLSNDQASALASSLAEKFGVDVGEIDSQSVGPSWGAEISRKALTGLFWFIIVLMIYLAFALEIRMAVAAIIAVIHDVLITVGLYAVTGLKVTPAAVIGFLTILGYSLYDTVVVFDKVRENVREMKRKSFDEYRKSVNLALNQTLIRSINTSIVAIIPIASILIIGAIFLKAETLKDISLALVIGQTIGTYSSIFIAAPLLVKLSSKIYKSNSGSAIIDVLSQTSEESQIIKGTARAEIHLDSFTIGQLKQSDAPDIFRALYASSEWWENLWVDRNIPENLEEFSALVRGQVSKNQEGSPISVVRSKSNDQISTLVVLAVDLINQSAELEIKSIFFEDMSDIQYFVNELGRSLKERGVILLTLWSCDLPIQRSIQLDLPLVEEVRLPGFYRTRSGRCDAIVSIFQLK